ncbi:MAG: ABC transporter ATP-binding protein [Aquificota bacterium]|nr:MAG: ABC transporter ATP-binding protein [Aquificota bacterium]
MHSNKKFRGEIPLLSVKNLKVSFYIENQKIDALKGVSFDIYPSEIVALVGESGSGKSVSCYSILKLLPSYAKVEGKISLISKRNKIENLLNLNENQMRKIRGNEISMVFQEPSSVLNPLFTIGQQIIETVIAHNNISRKEAKKLSLKAMEEAQIPEPNKRFYQYPHELSGGLKQRIAIAIASVNKPSVILADEPTTALDVTVGAKILNLFKSQKEKGAGILLITHDLGIVAEIADWVYVIKNGEIVENNNVYELFENPKHEYTKKLLKSRPIF